MGIGVSNMAQFLKTAFQTLQIPADFSRGFFSFETSGRSKSQQTCRRTHLLPSSAALSTACPSAHSTNIPDGAVTLGQVEKVRTLEMTK